MRAISRNLYALAFVTSAAFPGFASAQQKDAAAYMIAEISVTNPEKLAEFARSTTPLLKASGGEYVSRRSKVTPLVGDAPEQVTIIKFESLAKAQSYFNSADYKKLVPLRDSAGKFRQFFVEAGDAIVGPSTK